MTIHKAFVSLATLLPLEKDLFFAEMQHVQTLRKLIQNKQLRSAADLSSEMSERQSDISRQPHRQPHDQRQKLIQ